MNKLLSFIIFLAGVGVGFVLNNGVPEPIPDPAPEPSVLQELEEDLAFCELMRDVSTLGWDNAQLHWGQCCAECEHPVTGRACDSC